MRIQVNLICRLIRNKMRMNIQTIKKSILSSHFFKGHLIKISINLIAILEKSERLPYISRPRDIRSIKNLERREKAMACSWLSGGVF